jgi:hypothetical protein
MLATTHAGFMNSLKGNKAVSGISGQLQLARQRFAQAEKELAIAKEAARLAKRWRKEAKQAARRARKRVKLAKSEWAEATGALSKLEAPVAQTRVSPTKGTRANAPRAPFSKARHPAQKSRVTRKPAVSRPRRPTVVPQQPAPMPVSEIAPPPSPAPPAERAISEKPSGLPTTQDAGI